MKQPIYLVDEDIKRRAAICRSLAKIQIYVEPFENARELSLYRPRNGVVLLADHVVELAALQKDMAQSACWLPVICFAEQPTPQRVAQAVLDGATGYLPWPCSGAEVVTAMGDAVRNSEVVASLRIRRTRAQSRLERLTRRERQVLDAITDGLSNREIGERLAISARTVEIHRSNMLNKVGASHTSQAIKLAIEASLDGQA